MGGNRPLLLGRMNLIVMQNLIVLLAMSGRKACPQMEPKMSDVFSTSISSVRRPARLLSILALSATLSACGTFNVENDYPENDNMATEESGSVFDFFSFGGNEADAEASSEKEANTAASAAPQGLAVNADLWRAALETSSFLPLASADPIGGTIITDWYNDPGQDNERVKLNIIISGLELRADAVRVSMFREKRVNGRWTSVAASTQAARQMENIILTKARDFYIARSPR